MKNNHLIFWTWIWVFGYCMAIWLPLLEVSLLIISSLILVVGILWFMKLPGLNVISWIMLLSISIGYYQWFDQRNVTGIHAESNDEILLEMKGRITSSIVVDGDHVGFTIMASEVKYLETELNRSKKTQKVKESVQVSVRLLEQNEQETAYTWQRGDDISLSGKLQIPAIARNFGGFDYRQYLRQQHIHWIFTLKGLDSVNSQSSFHWNRLQLLRYNDQFRGFLADKLDQLFPESQAGYMKSLLIGLRVDLDPQQFQQFSNLGLTHILAISGMQVAVFCAVVLWFLRKLRFTKETGLLIAIALLPFYVLFTGSSPSVVRAGLMAMIALYAVRRNWLKDALKLLCLVGGLMLVWNPYSLLDVSFQLSFTVTYGLIVGVPWVSQLLPQQKLINSTLSVTLVAQAVSFPLTIYYFNQFSLLSWLANIILVPFISFVVTPIGSIALILSLVNEPTAQVIAYLAIISNRFTFWLTDVMDSWNGFKLIWASPSIVWISFYYGFVSLIIGCLIRWNSVRQARLQGVFIGFIQSSRGISLVILCNLCCFIGLLWYGYQPDLWRNKGQVQFIDVGQGDAILIHTPNNKFILVDGGGTLVFRKAGDDWKQRKNPYEVGKNTLVPLLKKRGVHHLDYLIATHEDADHIGGLQAVLEQIPVDNFIFNGTLKPNAGVEKLFKTALDLQIPLLAGNENLEIPIDATTKLHFLYPLTQKAASDNPNPTSFNGLTIENNQNNYSLVFMLEMYNSRFLFTGDMEKSSENILLEHLEAQSESNESIPIDVLKVAHHGSKTSTTEEWLNYWQPKLAAISVGGYNTYGHPTEEVLSRLAEHDVEVMRTDEEGEIQMTVTETGIQTRHKLK
ncbi:DNA internalization-related competence protein ComEC/Rec2 [Paenibacillus psychroresistens]|uniref:DNA internalization-related competence protein ComEC/Rec2 n=1 Tax=Paenibacillus psychroresistens TaxID=1778678 RepID=A0A6B8RJF2_9BACL|nr:DNA internalization-related competence protein ComEC/Rec2 [Paenibacillus psychroresistens]QGQ95683.1 DNA internalization-related competence protein ComEC/Rec2 [Paenibacillus psychroresistens]